MQPPPRADWFARCPADDDPLGNDRIGDCVPVAMLRAMQVRRANAWGDSWRPDTAEAVALYAQLAGYNPVTGAHDEGTDTSVAMTWWASTGIRSQQALDIVRWATVAPIADRHLKLAIAHTGPIQATLALPLAAEDTSTWARAPGTGAGTEPAGWGYHRVIVGAYDTDTLVCRTWGRDVTIHPEWWLRYAIGCDITLSRQWLDATGLAPSGLDWDALDRDMEALA
jgi:hypothetical protein